MNERRRPPVGRRLGIDRSRHRAPEATPRYASAHIVERRERGRLFAGMKFTIARPD